MQQWQNSESRPGYKTKTVKRGACTIIIERPILSDTERAKMEHYVQETVGHGLHNYMARKQTAAQSA